MNDSSSTESINHSATPTGLDNASQQQPAQAAQPQQQYHGKGEQQTAAQQPAQAQQWGNLPAAMRERPQWCVAGKEKRPLTVDGLAASSTKPSTWSSFDDVCVAAEKCGNHIGYMLAVDDPFTCIDLDIKDNDPDPDLRLKNYKDLIDNCDSYTEYSKSGIGYHIWLLGNIGKGCRHQGVEVYSQERFIICTGNVVNHKPIVKSPRLDTLVDQIRQNKTSSVVELIETEQTETDERVLQRALNADNADKFRALCAGEYSSYSSQSEADFALLSMFTFYSKSNSQCRRLFRDTELGKRDKATKNDDYLNRTLKGIRERENEEKIQFIDNGNIVKKGNVVIYLKEMLANDEARKKRRHERLHEISITITQSKSGISLFTSAQMRSRPPLKWQVKGVMPESGIGAIYGPPSSGKSFLALHMLSHIAEGKKWFNHRIKQAPVVYIAFEGTAGVAQRVEAYERENGEATNITYVEAPTTSLLIDADWQALVKELRPLFSIGKGVVCFDTLAASSPGMDENSSEGMGKLISNVKKMQKELGGVMLLVHHSGKNKEAGLRGWSGLTGALDFSIEVERPDKPNRSWCLKKSKDGADGIKKDFNLKKVVLGTDEDGDEISSCVALPVIANDAFSTVDHSSDDELVLGHIEKENYSGRRSSGRSIEKSKLNMTQARVRESIKRLRDQGRIKNEGTGNPWLVVVKI